MDRHRGGIRRALLALAATAAVLFASVSPLLAGHLALDRDCAPILVETHDHAAHRLTPAPAPDAGHCAACHLARSARGTAASRSILRAEIKLSSAVTSATASRTPAIRQADFTRGPPL